MNYYPILIAIFLLMTSSGHCQSRARSEPAPSKTNTNKSSAAAANDAVENEYEALLEADDKAQAEVDEWIQENQKQLEQGGGIPGAEMRRRIQERFASVRKGYENFLKEHPHHVKALVAYGSFLGDINDEDGAQDQLEKALALDTNNPAVYNNLANINGHTGDVKKSFEYYARAIALNPREPVYYHNFGTTVFLFRKDAREFYNITEQQVFDKALMLYSNAMYFDPTNFPLASDIAQTYYGIRPPRTEQALKSWTNALNLAHDELEREGVYVHLARVKLHAGRLAEARAHLNAVTNQVYAALKQRLTKNIEELEHPAANSAPKQQDSATNSVHAADAPAKTPPPSNSSSDKP